MAAPVRQQRAASLPPPVVALYPLDADQEPRARVNNSAPPVTTLVSSHEDDDAKCSDGSRLHSQMSTVSSRITTPEIPNSIPRSSVFCRNTKIARPSNALRTASSPLLLNQTGHNTPAIIIPQAERWEEGHLKLSIPSRSREQRHPRQSISNQSCSHAPDNSDIVPGCRKNRVPIASPASPTLEIRDRELKPAPRRIRAHSASTAAEGTQTLLEGTNILPPPPAFLRRIESTGDYTAPRFPTLLSPAPLPKESKDAFPSALEHPTRSDDCFVSPRQPQRANRLGSGSLAGSSVPSYSDEYSEGTSESASSSEEDPIALQNARQFPPRLPVGPGYWPSRTEGRTSALHNVTSWVARREQDGGARSTDPLAAETNLSAGASSTASSEDEIDEIWQTLKAKRARLAELRTQMGQARKELRRLRRRKNGADNAFMGVVRPLLVNLFNRDDMLHAPQTLLERRWTDMQRLSDEYHFLESNYEELEGIVDDEEDSLNRLETRFFSLLAAGQTRMSRPTAPSKEEHGRQRPAPVDTPDILLGISRDGPQEDLHPLYLELTSAVGDLENAKEDYSDLCWLRGHYQEELDLKQRTGQKIPGRLQEFLDEFPLEERTLKATITELQNEVGRLRQLCEDKKVMRKHMSARMVYLLDPTNKFEDMELDNVETILEQHKDLAHARFPELMSQPDHVLAEPQPLTPLQALKHAISLPDDDPEKQRKKRLASKEYAISSLLQDTVGGDNKVGLVNRWLLQSLRLDPINLVLLHTIFVSSCLLKIRDPWRWQCDVLHYWWKDDTTKYMPRAAATSTYLRYSSQQDVTPQISLDASVKEPSFG